MLKLLLMEKESFVSCAAIDALGKIGTSKNIQMLEQFLSKKDKNVRRAAALAIENIYKRIEPKLELSSLRSQLECWNGGKECGLKFEV